MVHIRLLLLLAPPAPTATAFDDGVGPVVGVVLGVKEEDDGADGIAPASVGASAGCAVAVHFDGSARGSMPVNGTGDAPKELN